MSRKAVEAWITKYALTSGIIHVNGEVNDGTLVWYGESGLMNFAHGEGREWHRSLDAALGRSEEMRLLRIESLRKSIRKVEKVKFKVVEGA